MQKIQIYKNLTWLNELPHAEAESAFRDCCGSTEWARQITEARPFGLLELLCEKAANIWFSLSTTDWLEAFAAHPKIGSSKPAAAQNNRASDWSAGEQLGVDLAEKDVRVQLAEANRLYQDKFGFIFIVCAKGKLADEMLATCRARFRNSVETELRIAAEEQNKITEIRLHKLLEK